MADEFIEEWRSIHDGYYEISNLGNVRRSKPGIATFVGRPLMPIAGPTGYSMVQLTGLTSRRAYVHHLVVEAFIGIRQKGLVVNHIDGNRGNNSASNLELISYQENAAHALKVMGRRRGPIKPRLPKTGRPTGEKHWTKLKPERIARGSKMPHCKLSPDAVRIARERVAMGEMQKSVALELGISVAQMSRIIRGLRWSYLP